ncbi:MAG: hypothetical protein ACOC9B_07060, partial [Chloroflexota bacterium]
MLTVSRFGPHEWHFVYPPKYDELMDLFHAGCELFEEDRLLEAEAAFRTVLARMPDHLDAIHHLALILSEEGEHLYARDLWQLSVVIGHMAFPAEFQHGLDRLPWLDLENRPFLRCLRGLALTLYENDEQEDALALFEECLSLNPNDNQGARSMALELLFALGRWEDGFNLTMRYPQDMMCETTYGRALALYRLRRHDLANAALSEAVEHHPRVQRELLKKTHRRPKPTWHGGMEVGGAEEAWEYWRRFGRFWRDTPGAFQWLSEAGKQR